MVTRREGVREGVRKRWIDGTVSSNGHGHGHSHDHGHGAVMSETRAPTLPKRAPLLFTLTLIVTLTVSVSVTI